MKKKKILLSDLKVKSFLTSLEGETINNVKGGTDDNTRPRRCLMPDITFSPENCQEHCP